MGLERTTPPAELALQEAMIALADPFQGGQSAALATIGNGEFTLALTEVPSVAVPVLRALLVVSHTLARVERLALRAIVRRKSPERVLPLLERHQALLQTQEALAATFVTMLNGGAAAGAAQLQ